MSHPYHPKNLPITLDYSVFANELADASFELGELNGLQRNIPNPSLLIAPLTTKEATVSSKIEGTRSTVRDVMAFEAGIGEKHDDTIEVVNYKAAGEDASAQATFFYRVTAMGFGARDTTRVVLQSFYRKVDKS